MDDGIDCPPTFSPTTTSSPTNTITKAPTEPCIKEIDISLCTKIGTGFISSCFESSNGNLDSGVGFYYYSQNCVDNNGGFGCISNTGCKNCRLTNADPEDWDWLNVCPQCVCQNLGIDSSLCETISCNPTISPTLKPSNSPTKVGETYAPIKNPTTKIPSKSPTTFEESNINPDDDTGIIIFSALGGGFGVIIIYLAFSLIIKRYKKRRDSIILDENFTPQTFNSNNNNNIYLNPPKSYLNYPRQSLNNALNYFGFNNYYNNNNNFNNGNILPSSPSSPASPINDIELINDYNGTQTNLPPGLVSIPPRNIDI